MKYYHDFAVGFNFWYVVAPMLVLVLGLIGSGRYYLDTDDNKIKRRGRHFSLMVKGLAMMADIVVLVLIIRESFVGILQVFANALRKDESFVWAFVLTLMLLPVVSVMYYILLHFAIKIGGYAKHGYLIEKKHEAREEERKEKTCKLFRYSRTTGNGVIPFPKEIDFPG